MFNRIIFLVLLFITLIASACEDGLLEETPDTFDSEAQIFSTEQGAETALNGVYYAFQQGNYHGASLHNLLMPVSGKFYSSQNSNIDATGLNPTPSNNSLVDVWQGAYETINEANIVIDNLNGASAGLANRDAVLGQAHFLRAATYFDLARLFGGVPLRAEPARLDNLNLPRASLGDVYAQIIADFELAEDLLPDDLPGRPGPLAATAYLAKVYLTRATTMMDDGFLAPAREHALEVIESGRYRLVDDYGDLFDRNNENTAESIFELQYGFTGGIRLADFSRIYTPRGSVFQLPNVSTFGRVRPNKETFDLHADTYPGDPRIDATFLSGEYERDGNTRTIYPRRTRGGDGYAVLAKYLDPSYNGTTTEANMIKLRYADVLLMMAEIENEMNGPDGAYPYVNQVLTRARNSGADAGATEPMNYSNLSQEEFRGRIRQERLFELLGEGHAWFDTRRHGYAWLRDNVIVPHNTHPNFEDGRDFEYPDDPKHLLLPLPRTELSGNSAIDVNDQNPGY